MMPRSGERKKQEVANEPSDRAEAFYLLLSHYQSERWVLLLAIS